MHFTEARIRHALNFVGSATFSGNPIYTWRKPRKYKETKWYNFQEAVKAHQNTAWEILEEKVFAKLDLKDL